MEPSRETIIGSEGVFMELDYIEDEICENSITFCWVCFAGKMPASNILYRILWVQEDERRSRIVNPAEKYNLQAAWIEPMTSR